LYELDPPFPRKRPKTPDISIVQLLFSSPLCARTASLYASRCCAAKWVRKRSVVRTQSRPKILRWPPPT
ncbi:hypothetical protein ACRALDRAFT_1095559, partial [Sodiomyces alcalophilus JCM 7366]|uniref:uncharacterized protein n=1 Tax=Sodiomyces alcalophilus JCM 7366 TaxID=591952 RepID=UPI0039B42D81